MTTLTERLGLKRHTLADRFRIQDYTDNWNLLDGAPGIFICTTATRPTWGTSQAGRSIYETDTKLFWQWSGSAWERVFGRGTVAHVERLSNLSTTSFSYTAVVSVATVIAAGSRRHLVVAQAPGAYSTQGLTGFALYRGGTLLQEWLHQGSDGAAAAAQPRPVSMVATDVPVDGSATYTLQFRAVVGFGGTCTIQGATNKPIGLTVVEV